MARHPGHGGPAARAGIGGAECGRGRDEGSLPGGRGPAGRHALHAAACFALPHGGDLSLHRNRHWSGPVLGAVEGLAPSLPPVAARSCSWRRPGCWPSRGSVRRPSARAVPSSCRRAWPAWAYAWRRRSGGRVRMSGMPCSGSATRAWPGGEVLWPDGPVACAPPLPGMGGPRTTPWRARPPRRWPPCSAGGRWWRVLSSFEARSRGSARQDAGWFARNAAADGAPPAWGRRPGGKWVTLEGSAGPTPRGAVGDGCRGDRSLRVEELGGLDARLMQGCRGEGPRRGGTAKRRGGVGGACA